MKILYVTTTSNTVNSFFLPHIKFLIDQGNEVGVAFKTFHEANPKLIEFGCKIHEVTFHRDPFNKENYKAYLQIKKLVLEEEYELVHVHTPVAAFLTRLACRKMRKVNLLYTAHGFHFFKGAPLKNWLIYFPLEKIAARWTDGLITMNNEDFYLAKKLRLRGKQSLYKVHGIGVDLNTFSPQTLKHKMNLRKEYGYSLNDFILIYVGELSYRKNQDLLIKAISKLKNKLTNLKLLLVGDGDYLNDYKKMVEQLELEQMVEFLGYRKDVHKLMALSDIAISTSRQEGLPVNVMEAMATGLPLIVTNCRGNRDLVSNGVNGFLIEVDNVESCSLAIKKLYYSEDIRRKFSEKNKEIIQIYSMNNVIEEMKNIYKEQSIKI